jgi:hypothetical protein
MAKLNRGKRNVTSSDSIVREDGSIFVVAPPDESSWQVLLQAARMANSANNGFDQKSTWWKRGVQTIFDTSTGELRPKTFTGTWTENSLKDLHAPPARADFGVQIEDRQTRLYATSDERDYATGENKLNWETSRSIHSKLGKIAITVFEFYLADTAEDQLKVDIAVFKSDGEIHLIELKKMEPKNSPLLAAVELICYACQIARCRSQLEHGIAKPLGMPDYRIRKLVLHAVAPEGWDVSWWKAGKPLGFEAGMNRLAFDLKEDIQKLLPVSSITFRLQTLSELLQSISEASQPIS